MEGVLSEGVADSVLRSACPELLDELVVDGFFNVDTRTSAAALSVVEVDTEVDPVDGLFEIGVSEDDVGTLASELEGDLLQVGASSRLHDLSADNGGTSEGNLVNVHVGGHGSTGNLAEARDDVDDTWWETSLLHKCGGNKGREGSLLSSLDYNGVTSGDGRANLPRQHEKGEVPGNDLTANTNLCKLVEGLCYYIVVGLLTGSLRM